MAAHVKDNYLVIGGSGFLGRHIVEALLARNDTVSVFDIVQRHHDVPFYSGDISEEGQVSDALKKVCFRCDFNSMQLNFPGDLRAGRHASSIPRPRHMEWTTQRCTGKSTLMAQRLL